MPLNATDPVREHDVRIAIRSQIDIAAARERGRALAQGIGLTPLEQTFVTGTISELARNIVTYAETGEICLRIVDCGRSNGIAIVARDSGPGIADVDRALTDGFSTSGRLGLGLPGVRRLMDQFEIVSDAGHGTVVTVTKWSAVGRRQSAA